MEEVIRYLTRDMSGFKIWWIDKKTDIIVWWNYFLFRIKNKEK